MFLDKYWIILYIKARKYIYYIIDKKKDLFLFKNEYNKKIRENKDNYLLKLAN